MPKEGTLIGHLRGEYATGEGVTITVYKIGNSFRLTGAGRPHLCSPDVGDIEGLKREAFRVYRIWNSDFVPS